MGSKINRSSKLLKDIFISFIYGVLFLSSLWIQAADGDLDTSFDSDGKVLTNVGFGSSSDFANSIAIQSNGKIVVVGSGNNGSDEDFAVVRYNTNGSLDTSFDSDGKVLTNVGSGASFDYAIDTAIQSDGKIVVGGIGNSGSDDDFAVVRYNTNGSLDTSFDSDGKVLTNVGSGASTDFAFDIAIQKNSKIVLAGYGNNGSDDDFAVVRYNTNGSLDTTFDSDGKVLTNVGPGSNSDYANGIAIQEDGKIVLVGYSDNGSDFDFGVVRYNANGSLDTSFDSDGKVLTSVGSGSSDDIASDIAIQDDGKIVVIGVANNGSNDDFAVVRYNTNGSLDTSFDSDGKVLTNIGPGSTIDNAADIAIQSDGKIVVVGYSNNGSSDDFAVVRYNTNGSLDTSFDSDGKVLTNIGPGLSPDIASDIAIQFNGKIVVAGTGGNTGNYDFAIVRYLSKRTPKVQFTVDHSSGPENAIALNLEVSLDIASTTDTISVDFAVTGGNAIGSGNDYTLANGTVHILPGNTMTSIPITLIDDNLDEVNETIIVTLSNPVNAILGNNLNHTYTILDNDVLIDTDNDGITDLYDEDDDNDGVDDNIESDLENDPLNPNITPHNINAVYFSTDYKKCNLIIDNTSASKKPIIYVLYDNNGNTINTQRIEIASRSQYHLNLNKNQSQTIQLTNFGSLEVYYTGQDRDIMATVFMQYGELFKMVPLIDPRKFQSFILTANWMSGENAQKQLFLTNTSKDNIQLQLKLYDSKGNDVSIQDMGLNSQTTITIDIPSNLTIGYVTAEILNGHIGDLIAQIVIEDKKRGDVDFLLRDLSLQSSLEKVTPIYLPHWEHDPYANGILVLTNTSDTTMNINIQLLTKEDKINLSKMTISPKHTVKRKIHGLSEDSILGIEIEHTASPENLIASAFIRRNKSPGRSAAIAVLDKTPKDLILDHKQYLRYFDVHNNNRVTRLMFENTSNEHRNIKVKIYNKNGLLLLKHEMMIKKRSVEDLRMQEMIIQDAIGYIELSHDGEAGDIKGVGIISHRTNGQSNQSRFIDTSSQV